MPAFTYNARHGEFAPVGEGVEVVYYSAHPEDFGDALDALPLTDEVWARVADIDDDDRQWVTVIEVRGDLDAIRAAFGLLLDDLRARPSGDDDVFDYWPSGMRLAYAMAGDLDAAAGNTAALDAYREVVRSAVAMEVPEVEFSAPLAGEFVAERRANAACQDYLAAWAKKHLSDGDEDWHIIESAIELIQETY